MSSLEKTSASNTPMGEKKCAANDIPAPCNKNLNKFLNFFFFFFYFKIKFFFFFLEATLLATFADKRVIGRKNVPKQRPKV